MIKQLTLPSGRSLDYDVAGAKDGKLPLVWLHGTPGGSVVMPSLAAACEKRDIPLIVFSRSGYGNSSRNKGRRIVDEVEDVRALLDHLGFEKCFVGGWSGGGPHALACAARLRGILAVVSVASVAPYDAEGLDYSAGMGEDNIEENNAALEGEAATQSYCAAQRDQLVATDAAGFTEVMASILPDIDKKTLLESDEMGNLLVSLFTEGLKNGCDGWVDDNLAFVHPWGFNVADIKIPVFLYQGSDDKMVPFSHGQWLGENIPKQHLTKHLEEGQGHISIFLGRLDGMLDELLSVSK